MLYHLFFPEKFGKDTNVGMWSWYAINECLSSGSIEEEPEMEIPIQMIYWGSVLRRSKVKAEE